MDAILRAGCSSESPYAGCNLKAGVHQKFLSLLALSLVQSAAEGLIEPLTGREIEVLALLAQRLTYKEIGAQLFISAGTVSQHAVRIYQKLQVNNRRQAVVKAQALGLLAQR
jgi:ATP/maltotriose-dependent transcriptional regulator MalT